MPSMHPKRTWKRIATSKHSTYMAASSAVASRRRGREVFISNYWKKSVFELSSGWLRT
jgi:hypothetical protein